MVVVVDAAPDLSAQLAALHPEEQRLAAAMKPIRQREWVAGRTALRAALRQAALLGAEPGHPLLKDDRGAPLLPAAALGSVSHKGDRAAALVAPRPTGQGLDQGLGQGLGLGLDLELVAGPRVDISQRVLTEREQGELAALPAAARASALALRFSLKEAVYKAIDPWVRRYVGFREVELVLAGPDDPDEREGPDELRRVALDAPPEGALVADASQLRDSGRGRCFAVAPALREQLGACSLEVSWSRLGEYWVSTARARR